MFFNEESDWKECLTEDGKQKLAELFELAKKHKCAYMNADDVKIAQLWCAMAEFRQEFKETLDRVEKLAEPFRAIISMGDAEKRKTIERVVTDMLKPVREEDREATKKLVDSLMKF